MKSTKMQAREITIPLPGLNLAAKVWGNPEGLPTLALHGWLDNAASFDRLAPLLDDLYLVCLDMPGHGLSEHKPHGTYLHLIDIAIDVIQVANHLKWSSFALLGHSLGAALASLIAGTLQDRILGLALIDGLGMLTTEAEKSPMQLRQFLQGLQALPDKKLPIYSELDDAITARIAALPMERSAAKEMLKRSLKETGTGEWTWGSDPRLKLAPALQLTRSQTQAFLQDITAPSLFIRPQPGYPFDEAAMAWRIEAVSHLKIQHLKGGHHIHLEKPEEVAAVLNPFFHNITTGWKQI